MKLSRALKLKKKLSGEVAKIQQLITAENMQLDENQSNFNVSELLGQLKEKQNKLILVKTEIAKANSEIWFKIFTLAELKSFITFLRGLDTREGSFNEGFRFNDNIVKKFYNPQINKVNVEKRIAETEKMIELFQEEVDEFNQLTQIDLEI